MPQGAEKAYAEIIAREKERTLIESVRALLDWDESTFMPKGGAQIRGDQKAYLAREFHERLIDPRLADALSEVEGSALMKDEKVGGNVRAIRRWHDRACKVPPQLVEKIARDSSASIEAWMAAKERSDFSVFRPHLEKMVEYRREEAQAVGYKTVPYDALLEYYEPGMTVAELNRLFGQLKPRVANLVKEVADSPKRPNPAFTSRKFSIEAQRRVCETAMKALGFDGDRGRLDVSTHPFCQNISPADVRLTTRYCETDFFGSLFSTIHETGHGLYEQGLDVTKWGLPAARACSMGIHESQSRLWENLVARTAPFWEFFFPVVKSAFPEAMHDLTRDDLLFRLNAVERTFIRTESDEVTYNLHIILRFELEQGLLLGDLKVADVPEAWNAKFKELFGLTPPDQARGCLQDIHWSTGDFGYFPTYSLGNLYGAQFMEKAREDIGDLEDQLRRGEFKGLRQWLSQNVYRWGATLLGSEVCLRATGKPLSVEPLVRHFESKCRRYYA